MRILVVSSYPPRRCGIGAYARDQVAALRGEGHEVTVLSAPDGVGDVRAPLLGGRAFLRAARMGGGFDRVVVHFQPALYYRPRAPLSKVATSAALLWLVARRRRTEVIVHEADPPLRWRPDYALLSLALRLAPRLLFHTEAERRAFERSYGGTGNRGEVVPHRVAAAAVPPSRAEARRSLGLPQDGPVFVCAGFLQPSKGFERAVSAFGRAFAGSPGTEPAPRLFVVGSVREGTPANAAYVEDLRTRCEATPGATLVEGFAGDEEFDRWVAAADRVLLPYARAWSSGLLARAQALGTPAIVAAVGGLAQQAGPADVVVAGDDELEWAMREAARAPRPVEEAR